MKKVKGMPITGAKPQQSWKKPFVPNAKDTSAATQTMIKEPPTPFKDSSEAPQSSIPAGSRGAVPGTMGANGKGIYAGKSGSKVGAKALPQLGAVGQTRPINQSGQIGGRMSFPPPARKAGSQNLSKVKKGAAFYGE